MTEQELEFVALLESLRDRFDDLQWDHEQVFYPTEAFTRSQIGGDPASGVTSPGMAFDFRISHVRGGRRCEHFIDLTAGRKKRRNRKHKRMRDVRAVHGIHCFTVWQPLLSLMKKHPQLLSDMFHGADGRPSIPEDYRWFMRLLSTLTN